jgi:aspartate/methionine/tyrosine aminotransferase
MSYSPATKPTKAVELRTGRPYANLIAKQAEFASSLGELLGINPNEILPTPGTTGAIESIRNHVFRVSGKAKPAVLTVCPGYWRARESLAGFGFEIRNIHTEPNRFSIDEDALVHEARDGRADLIYLSLPNNPTGAIFSPDSIINNSPAGAAIALDMTLPSRDLDTQKLTGQLYKTFSGRRNLYMIGSTSKSHGTAEYRVGWLICAHPEDADVLKHENRNVVSCVAIDRGIEVLHQPPPVLQAIQKSFALLEEGERMTGFEVIRPERRVQTAYVLIRHRFPPVDLRNAFDKSNIRVMWGSEFGLDDQYIRLETLEPANVKVFVDVAQTRL